METEEWGVLFFLVIIMLGVAAAISTPTFNPFGPKPTPTWIFTTPSPSFTQIPYPTLVKTPTPSITPPTEPTPNGSRYCLNNGSCFWGTPATPTPTPSPTPSPIPKWVVAGYKCEVPDYLVGAPWITEYRWSCACVIRGKWDLGVNFNVWEGCYAMSSGAWRRESCECVSIICEAEPRLC